MNSNQKSNFNPPEAKTSKKTYSTPEVFVYGDVRELTKATANNTVGDGPPHGNQDKTA
jgi:hypothetical protein